LNSNNLKNTCREKLNIKEIPILNFQEGNLEDRPRSDNPRGKPWSKVRDRQSRERVHRCSPEYNKIPCTLILSLRSNL